jgi:hypothetical protein
MTSHVRVPNLDALLSCRQAGPGRDYFLHVVPRGGCTRTYQLNETPTDGTPEDEELFRQEAAAILSQKHGLERDLSGVGFEVC